jgi:undecaprenyl-diphosphatase
MGLSNLVVLISNSIYERDRPYLDLDVTLLLYKPTEYSSFPSNAAAAVFGIAFAVALVNRKLGLILIVAATVYGLSRIYVGVHYPIDVLAGMTIALFVSRFVLLVRPFVQSILDRFLTVARVFCLA